MSLRCWCACRLEVSVAVRRILEMESLMTSTERQNGFQILGENSLVAKAEKRKVEYENKVEAYNRNLAGGDDDESDKSKSEVNDEDDEGSEEVAIALEKTPLLDEYFVKRKLYPNVDLDSRFIYRAMGFPRVLSCFVCDSSYGCRESLDEPDTKIIRPAQVV